MGGDKYKENKIYNPVKSDKVSAHGVNLGVGVYIVVLRLKRSEDD